MDVPPGMSKSGDHSDQIFESSIEKNLSIIFEFDVLMSSVFFHLRKLNKLWSRLGIPLG